MQWGLWFSMVNIRPITPGEIDYVARAIAIGYFHDVFFEWCVPEEDVRHHIVTEYYKIYLHAPGCVAHVLERPGHGITGAAVWLPHDVDEGIYEAIDRVVGKYKPQFAAVGRKSHDSEPPMAPFYQLVGFAVSKAAQGQGFGGMLLGYHLDILDRAGIPTYLEASTPYFGGGVYGKFGYQPVGELMTFDGGAVLYPLWRAPKPLAASLNHPQWEAVATENGKTLLVAKNVLELASFHHTFADVTWANASIRQYLNSTFLESLDLPFTIVETPVYTPPNPWFGSGSGETTMDKIFLLSVEEVVKYFGDSGQLKAPQDMFYISDDYDSRRQATYVDGQPARWMLRTPGNLSYMVATVTNQGKISMTGDFVNRHSTDLFNVGIRPAMWVED